MCVNRHVILSPPQPSRNRRVLTAAPRSLLFLRTRNARKSSGLSPQTREVFEKSTRLFRKTPPLFNVLARDLLSPDDSK